VSPAPNYIEVRKTINKWIVSSKTKEITESGTEMAEVYFSGE
jgi:hypothetical protein